MLKETKTNTASNALKDGTIELQGTVAEVYSELYDYAQVDHVLASSMRLGTMFALTLA